MKEDAPQLKSDKMKNSERDRTKTRNEGADTSDEEMETTETKVGFFHTNCDYFRIQYVRLWFQFLAQVEGDIVQTMRVERGLETTFHTGDLNEEDEEQQILSLEYIESLKNKVQENLAAWSQVLLNLLVNDTYSKEKSK